MTEAPPAPPAALLLSGDLFFTSKITGTAAAPVRDGITLAGVAIALVRGEFPLRRKVRLLGVTVSGFEAGGEGHGAQPAFDFGQPG